MRKKYWNQIYINRNVKFMPFLYHGSHLGFQDIRTRKNYTLFFLMFISYSNRIRQVFAFTKKYTNFYFMTNEPTLEGVLDGRTMLLRDFEPVNMLEISKEEF